MIRKIFLATVILFGAIAFSMGTFQFWTGGAVGVPHQVMLGNSILVMFIIAGLVMMMTPVWSRCITR